MKVLVTGDSTLGEELGLAHAVAEGEDSGGQPPAPENHAGTD